MKIVLKFIPCILLIVVFIMACSSDNEAENLENSNPSAFTVTVSSITESSAVLNWTSSNDVDGDEVTYTVTLNGIEIVSNISSLLLSLTDLELDTLYSGSITANDGNGGSASANFDFTTLAEAPTLHPAYADFDVDYTDIYLDGSNVIIETIGEPNHLTPYYSTSHPLYTPPTVTNVAQMTPTRIDTANRDYNATLTVSTNPQMANSTSATQLGSIGIAVSGAFIYNDQEGNGPLDSAAGSLDYAGAHIGPSNYHYHLEPLAFTNDDQNLVGIISDGFFIYGRKCNSTGTYPTDLDASGGHTSTTQHADDAEYHYHIINEVYGSLGRYLVFAGPYQGTPNAIN
ncbi:YHYH protein [Ichthyenterobacterium sp. W332]|uniref:YHYH protein n=1 Tax=Microcosmobacter mediterraneus TaxID=3075607 RepID=A0ABU2YJ92_9FLAO|nr:YHYH protein [Ichthyenterobacterium sp. W332]MDT0557305.1 YHYH protein [Ichthyenterobacterium sp. W332]